MISISEKPDLEFMKWHGAGNDFVIIDSRGGSTRMSPPLAARLGDRHRGVGFDQLAEIHDSDDADIALDFWNADGSRAGACGNATRCVADHVMAESGREHLTIRTERGLLIARREAGNVWVNMGQPQQDWRDVPLAQAADLMALPLDGAPAAVGMGNPHLVFLVDDAEKVDLAGRGPVLEHDPLFPDATNVEFAHLAGPDRLRMRVWERGTGITLACGSGACATAVIAAKKGLTGRRVAIEADGGTLTVDWRDDGVWLTGPTAHVFDARLTSEFLAELP